MEKSASSTDLANLLESLTANNSGPVTAANVTGSAAAAAATVAEQALKNLLGAEVPLEAGVEGAADFFAEKLGLRSKSLVQTSVFVLTKASILETARLVGIGGGLAKLDLVAFEMAQLKKQVEEINQKLDVILSTPLQLAMDFFGNASHGE